jgi:hypothetical protein
MAINGRINVDVLFHDTDGTTSLKVVSLDDSTEYTTGKVAIVTGTLGTAAATVSISPTTYRNAAGELVSFDAVSRLVTAVTVDKVRLESTSINLTCIPGQPNIVTGSLFSDIELIPDGTVTGSSYTLVMYGT